MRLVFVSHSFSPAGRALANVGGMQRVAVELHDALTRRPELDLRSVVLRSTWRWVHWRTPWFLVSSWWSLRTLLRRGDVDVVLFSSMVTASLAVPLRSARGREGVRLAAIAHGLDVTTPFRPYQRFVRRVFENLDLVLPVSRATGAACVARGLEPSRMRPVRNGVDHSRFDEPVHDRLSRRELLRSMGPAGDPIPDSGLILVSLGRHVRRKGFEWFVRNVLPRLEPDIHYWLAGEGPETGAIEAAARECGVSSRVRLLGRLSEVDLRRLLAGGDLFVMPNIPVEGDMEGFGVVILEAGLSGLPTVGARLEGIAEVIVDHRNGILVPTGEATAFVETIHRFRARPDELADASRRARAFTLAEFGWDAVAAEYADALNSLVRRG